MIFYEDDKKKHLRHASNVFEQLGQLGMQKSEDTVTRLTFTKHSTFVHNL
jgi:hypothetical protein